MSGASSDGTKLPDIDPEFIVVCASVWANDRGCGIAYDWDGARFNNRSDAIKHGLEIRYSDDFNIAQTYGDDLIWFGWMDQRIDEDEDGMRHIAEEIGLSFDPRWYRLEFSKATGKVVGIRSDGFPIPVGPTPRRIPMVESETLKACPHCGGSDVEICGTVCFWVRCECGDEAASGRTRDEAVALWNTRTPDPSAQARIEELERIVWNQMDRAERAQEAFAIKEDALARAEADRDAFQAQVEALTARIVIVEGERDALAALINTPETADWLKGAELEAAHQVVRWGADHDAGKTAWDWFWLVGYLAQKAAAASVGGDPNKAKHHTISTAAALLNWHRQLSGSCTRMRPGIDPVARRVA